MKVTLTNAELLEILSAKFEANIESYTITDGHGVLAARLCGVIEDLKFTSSEKIAAIKTLRAATGCGLADSKYAIENWDKFINFVRTNDRLPKEGWANGDLR